LALAHRIDGMIRAGELKDLAGAARACGITRARMSQISNLLLLGPAIQEAILTMPSVTTGRDTITERQLRPIVAEPDWSRQASLWRTAGVASSIRIVGVGVGVGVDVGVGDAEDIGR
jgi:hypothetical protein